MASETINLIDRYCKKQKITINSFFFTLNAAIIVNMTKKRDFVLGFAVDGRNPSMGDTGIREEEVYSAMMDFYLPIIEADMNMFYSCSKYTEESSLPATVIFADQDINVNLKCSLDWCLYYSDVKLIKVPGGHLFIAESDNLST